MEIQQCRIYLLSYNFIIFIFKKLEIWNSINTINEWNKSLINMQDFLDICSKQIQYNKSTK